MAEAQTVTVLLQAKDQASATIDKVDKKMGGLATSFGKHRQKIGMAATAIGAGITAIGLAAANSFQEEKLGIQQLDAALKGAGSSYDAQKKSIEGVVAAQQNKTNFGDEEQRVALRKLILASGDYENSLKVLPTLLDVAAGSGKSMEGVALAVGRAIGGEATALKAYGVTLEATAGPLEVITALQQKFAGQAEAAADPMTQLKNRLGDLTQELGKVLLPIIEKVIPKIEDAVKKVIEWTQAHPDLTKMLGLTAAAVGAIMLVAGPFLLLLPTLVAAITILSVAFGALSLSMLPITLTIVGIGAVITAGLLIWKNWDKVIGFVKKEIALFTKFIVQMGKDLLKTFRSMIDWIPGMDGVVRILDKGIRKLDDISSGMEDWANTGQQSFSDVGEAASDSERQIARASIAAQEDMAGLSGASETMAAGVKTNTEKVQTSFRTTAGVVTEETAEMIKAQQEVSRAVELAATAAQEAGDTTIGTHTKVVGSYAMLQQAVKEHGADFLRFKTEGERISNRWKEAIIKNIEEVGFAMDEEGNSRADNLRVQKEQMEISVRIEETRAAFIKDIQRQVAEGYASTMDEIEGDTMDSLSRMIAQSADARRQIATAAAVPIPAAICEAVIPKPVIPTVKPPVIPPVKRVAPASEAAATIAETWAEAAAKATKDRPGGGLDISGVGLTPAVGQSIQDWAAQMDAALASAGLTGREKFAHGGVSRGGLALVGERGPEVVSLPGGARVHPSGTGPGSNQFHFHGAVYGLEDLRRVVVEAVRDHALSGGFRGVFGET